MVEVSELRDEMVDVGKIESCIKIVVLIVGSSGIGVFDSVRVII